MKRSSKEHHEVLRLSPVPWQKIPNRGATPATPWIGFDPELRSDCSAAYRAFRLTMLALFAIFGAGNRAQAQSEPQLSTARIETQSGPIAEFKTPAPRQAQEPQLRQQAVNDLREGPHTDAPDIARFTRIVAEDKRQSAQLTVDRTHAPPRSNLFSIELLGGFGTIRFFHGFVPNRRSEIDRPNKHLYFFHSAFPFTGTTPHPHTWVSMLASASASASRHALRKTNGGPVFIDTNFQTFRMRQDCLCEVEKTLFLNDPVLRDRNTPPRGLVPNEAANVAIRSMNRWIQDDEKQMFEKGDRL